MKVASVLTETCKSWRHARQALIHMVCLLNKVPYL
jgi:hypothetical protein